MSTEDNKRIVRRWIEEVINTGDIARIDEFVAPDYVEVHDGVAHQVGPDGASEHVLGVRRTYPDLRVTVERQIAEGEWVATVITARGTHAGEWLGIDPTGEQVQITGVNVDRVVDGLIVEHGGAANMLEALLAIGAVRVVGPGTPGNA